MINHPQLEPEPPELDPPDPEPPDPDPPVEDEVSFGLNLNPQISS